MVQFGIYYNIDSGEFSFWEPEIPETSTQQVDDSPKMSPRDFYRKQRLLKMQQEIQYLEAQKRILELKKDNKALQNN